MVSAVCTLRSWLEETQQDLAEFFAGAEEDEEGGPRAEGDSPDAAPGSDSSRRPEPAPSESLGAADGGTAADAGAACAKHKDCPQTDFCSTEGCRKCKQCHTGGLSVTGGCPCGPGKKKKEKNKKGKGKGKGGGKAGAKTKGKSESKSNGGSVGAATEAAREADSLDDIIAMVDEL